MRGRISRVVVEVDEPVRSTLVGRPAAEPGNTDGASQAGAPSCCWRRANATPLWPNGGLGRALCAYMGATVPGTRHRRVARQIPPRPEARFPP